MNSFAQELATNFTNRSYRFALAIYGAAGYVLATYAPTAINAQVYDVILKNKNFAWKSIRPDYPWGYNVLLIGIPLFFLVYFAPQIMLFLTKGKVKSSLAYGMTLLIFYTCVASISLLNFGLNTPKLFEFIGLGFIVVATEFVKGIKTDYTFVSDNKISEEVKLRKIELTHKKWFNTIGFLVTVSIAVLGTAAVKNVEMWNQNYGTEAALLLSKNSGALVLYSGAGLVLGPFFQMFKILTRIEDQLSNIRLLPNERVSRKKR